LFNWLKKKQKKIETPKYETIIIDDSEPDYYVQITFYPETTSMDFWLKNPNDIIQGGVDDVLGYEEIPTGIGDLVMYADDGSFSVFHLSGKPIEIELKQPIIEWFKKTYLEHKNAFKEGVMEYIDANREWLEKQKVNK